jgi:hypothetical protein
MPPSKVPEKTFVALSAIEPVFGGTVVASAEPIGMTVAADTAAIVPSAYQNVVKRFRMILKPHFGDAHADFRIAFSAHFAGAGSRFHGLHQAPRARPE